MSTKSPPNVSINIGGSNSGIISVGDRNLINQAMPSLGALGLGPAETARIEAALKSLCDNRAADNPDAKALQSAAGEHDEKTRAEKIKGWLLKIAPHAAALAGSIVNPVVGELAKAATEWAAHALGNKT